jgi:hypothetical protein
MAAARAVQPWGDVLINLQALSFSTHEDLILRG